MATTTSITSTYAGQFSGKYIAAALLSAPTLDKELITLKPNIKYKEVIKKYTNTDIIFDGTCDFSPTSTVSLSEQILQPDEFQVNLTLCKKDFRSDWEALEMGISIYDHLPPTFTDFMIGQVAGQVAQKIEQNIWTGNGNVNGQFASFTELLTSGSTAGGLNAPISGSFTAAQNVTGSSTVLAGLDKVVQQIPITVYGKEDLGIYVSTATMKAFQTAVGGGSSYANGYMNQTVIGLKPMDFQGIPLLHCPGMPATTVIAAEKSNLFFGTALLSDKNEVKVLDMADLDGSQNVRIVMRYTAGVQYGIGSDIVWYY
jgi:hypothetical protein